MCGEIEVEPGKKVDLLPLNLKRIHNEIHEKFPNRYTLQGGYLEKVIEKKLESYDSLIWKNFYYGKIKKHIIKNLIVRTGSMNPTHSLHPEAFSELDKVVFFPEKIRKYYQQLTKG